MGEVDVEEVEPRQEDEEKSQNLILDAIIPYQINRLSHRMNRLLEVDLRKYDLSIAAWRVLAVVDFNAGVSMSDLQKYAMIEQSTLSRLLRRLERDGLISIRTASDDNRVKETRLTTVGQSALDMAQTTVDRHVGRIVHGLDEDDRKTLLRLVRKMRLNLR